MAPAARAARYRAIAAKWLIIAQRQENANEKLALIDIAQAWIALAELTQKIEPLFGCTRSPTTLMIKMMTKPITFHRRSNDFRRMSDQRARFRLKALACRRLADLAEDAEREALWRKRANDWERSATGAEKRLRPKS
jgi:hypothetical protein